MNKTNEMGQFVFTGMPVDQLLSRIEQLIDAKISVTPKNENNPFDYLSRKEVASLLKITLPTLHAWTQQGLLRAYKMGTRVLYKPNEVKDALEKSKYFKNKKGGWHV